MKGSIIVLVALLCVTALAEGAPVDRLTEGNQTYLSPSDAGLREDLAVNGQHPYAVVIACSDSRVIPEALFSATFGDLFVIRVAGNVLDDHQMGSVQYAVEHLGCKDVILLGHTGCGAIGAALEAGHAEGYVGSIVEDIHEAIGDETDPDRASEKNVRYGVERLREAFPEADVRGAVFDIASGEVTWLE